MLKKPIFNKVKREEFNANGIKLDKIYTLSGGFFPSII